MRAASAVFATLAVGAALAPAWQDTDERGACVFCAFTGLVTVDRQAKPALAAYRRAALGG